MVLNLYIQSEAGLLAIKGTKIIPYQDTNLYEVEYPQDLILTQSVELALLLDRYLIDIFGIEAFHNPYT